MGKLRGKMELFCVAYVGAARGNAMEAARMAGYSSPKGSASKNMEKGEILGRIEELRQELEQESGALSPAEIHTLWASIARDESVSVAQRLVALRDAARAQAMFIQRIDVRVERPEQTMSDEELEREIRRLEGIKE